MWGTAFTETMPPSSKDLAPEIGRGVRFTYTVKFF